MEELIYRDRRGTNSNKWNHLTGRFTREGLLGLWVADMDFAAPACVREALRRKVDFGVFGYDTAPDSYYEAFIRWEKTYHGYAVQRDWLRYSPGVVAAFNWFVQLFTQPGDGVLVQTPVYYPFLSAATDNGCRLICSELVNTDGVYTIDFADFERKLAEERVKVFLLCSPHNPVGRVWRREELERMLSLCRQYGVRVIADEIHHDFTYGEPSHIPTATVGDHDDMLVTLTAPSKTFNLAGLKTSVIIIPDPELRKSWDAYTGKLHTDSGNSFGVTAAEAAYTGGRPWLDQVLRTVPGELRDPSDGAAAPEAGSAPLSAGGDVSGVAGSGGLCAAGPDGGRGGREVRPGRGLRLLVRRQCGHPHPRQSGHPAGEHPTGG